MLLSAPYVVFVPSFVMDRYGEEVTVFLSIVGWSASVFMLLSLFVRGLNVLLKLNSLASDCGEELLFVLAVQLIGFTATQLFMHV